MMGDSRGVSVGVSMLVYVSVHLIACRGACICVHPGVFAVLHCLSMPSCMCRHTCGLGLHASAIRTCGPSNFHRCKHRCRNGTCHRAHPTLTAPIPQTQRAGCTPQVKCWACREVVKSVISK